MGLTFETLILFASIFVPQSFEKSWQKLDHACMGQKLEQKISKFCNYVVTQEDILLLGHLNQY